MRSGLFALLRKRDNWYHLFGCKVVIVSIGVMVAITTEMVNVHFQIIFPRSFEKAVKVFDREGVIALISARHDSHEREIVAILMGDQMIVAVTEQKTVPVGIIAPGGGRA